MLQDDPINEPQIQNRTVPPRGVVPKNAQARVLGLIALAMVLIIAFTGRSTPSKEPRVAGPALGSTANGPNPATIDDFVHQMDDRTKKLAEAKAELEEEQKSLVLRNAVPGRPADAGPGYPPPAY